MKKAKVKIDFKKVRKQIIKEAKKTLPALLQRLIVEDHIKKGKSPVAGFGNFDPYSISYVKAINEGRYSKYGKTIKPVNLKVTGQLLESFYVRFEGGKVAVGFDDPLAEVHNTLGTRHKGVIRKMLPTEDGESLTPKILKEIVSHMKKIAIKVLK